MVRYADLIPCRTTPVGVETFTIIGSGASDDGDQHVHITQKHGLNIAAARQSFGCLNMPHSRDAAEVFIVHSGRWRLAFGANGEDGALEVGPGGVASAPAGVYRGFEKLDDLPGFLWIILGDDHPEGAGRAPAVWEVGLDHPSRLARGGRLIDTTSGGYELKDVDLADQSEDDPSPNLQARLEACVATAESLAANPRSRIASDGVAEHGVIATRATRDGFGPGPITGWWPHEFNLRLLRLRSGAYIPMHTRSEPEVFLVHEGALEASWAEGSTILAAGDVATFPIGMPRAFRNTSSAEATIFVVRGTDDPAPPVFLTSPSAP